MIVYYDQKAVISTHNEFRTYYKKDGSEWISDFSIPFGFNALEELRKAVETHLEQSVTLLPSEFSEKLEAHRADPKNWPTGPHEAIGFGNLGRGDS